MKNYLNRPILAIVLAIVIVILGLLSIATLPVEQYPSISPPNIQVTATYNGADATSTNDAVAIPLSQAIMGIDDMLYIQSTSTSSGDMTINVTYGIDSDPDMDAVFTQNYLQSATPLLPTSVKEQGVTVTKSNSDFLMIYSLYSDGRYDPLFLSNYANINIVNELLKINGVGNVQVLGSSPYSMRIWIDPTKLDYYGVSLSEIESVIEYQSGVHATGDFGAEPYHGKVDFTYTVVLPPQITSPQQYGDIIVKTLSDGSTLRLGDLSRLELGALTYGSSSKYNDLPAVVIGVFQAPGSNAMSVGEALNSKMEELSERFYDGIEYSTIINAPAPIKKGIADIILTLTLALILVVAIVFLFIQRLRALIIPVVAIPVSLVGAFMLFPVLGLSINVFSLLGLILAIGLVVDDAIVVVEAVQVNIAQGHTPRRATQLALKAVSSPIIATSLSLAAVFIPVSFISGITGELFKQFAVTIALSVAISAFNALTLSPALCAIVLREGTDKQRGFFGWFNRWFNSRTDNFVRRTRRFTHRSYRALLLIGVLVVGVYFIMREIPSGFIPQEDEGYFMVAVQLPDAASVERTTAVLDKVHSLLAEEPSIANVATLAGFNMLNQTMATNSGIAFVQLKDYSERTLSASQLIERLNGELYFAVGEAQVFAFEMPAIPGLGSASGLSIMLQDRGSNSMEYLAQNSFKFIEEATKLPEIGMATTQFSASVPQRLLKIDTNKAINEGISAEELYNVVATYLGSSYINNFNRFGQIYETYVELEAKYRQDKRGLESIFLRSSSGNEVPLSSFVEVRDTLGVEFIQQFNLFPAVAINATTAKGISTGEAMAALEKLAAETLPQDMTLEWSGMSYEEKAAGSTGGLFAFGIALLFVYLILSALYESWILPLAILLGVPIALFGAGLLTWVVRFYDSALTDNIFMQISLILLIGLSAKNAILIVEYANTKFFEEGKDATEAALEAARLRFRPILMTALAFLLGVLPLVLAGGPTKIAQNTLGYALIGGMTLATLIGVYVYPLLYIFFAKVGKFERIREKREQIKNETEQ
ncbi:MAG: efflux RND transporter permease subunit [Rikenellaceae bacterium]